MITPHSAINGAVGGVGGVNSDPGVTTVTSRPQRRRSEGDGQKGFSLSSKMSNWFT